MFTHILESYLSSESSAPVSDAISEALMKKALYFGEVVYNNPSDIEARESLSWISALALSNIPNAGRRGPHPMHRLEHPISGKFNVSHGRGLSAIMPAYLIYTFNLHKDRLKALSEGLFGEKDAKLAVAKIVEWLKKVDALNGLKDLGIGKESFNDFLESALRDDNNEDFIRARENLYRNEILEIYNLAFDYSNIDEMINSLT